MDRDLELEKEELLREIDGAIDPDLKKVLTDIQTSQEPPRKFEIVSSAEGTSSASTK